MQRTLTHTLTLTLTRARARTRARSLALTLILTRTLSLAQVKWSESGDLVCLSTEDSFYVLRYNKEVVAAAMEGSEPIGEEGVEGAFDLVHEISEQIRTCIWVGDCLIYTNVAGRLNYTVGGEVITLQHLDRPLYIVGYLPKENRCAGR